MRLMWECTKDLCCLLFFFAVVVDDVTEFARESVLSKWLHADDLFLMSEITKGFINKFM